MTPSSNSGGQEAKDTVLRLSDIWTLPCDAVIESWFAADSDGSRFPLEALVELYREGELTREQCRRVEARLATDPKFRACLEEYDREQSDGDGEDDGQVGRAEPDGGVERSRTLLELEWQGIRVPEESRVQRREGAPRRSAPLYSQAAPVGANDFLPRLLDELGTPFGMELVDHAFRVVMVAGDADEWIRVVARARDRGGLNPAVANFLIAQFAASAVRGLCATDPVLSGLNAQIERIERAYDSDELFAWSNYAGPPEWEALCEQWDAAYDGHLIRILERNDEYEVLRDVFSSRKPYAEGWMQIYRV